MAPPNYSIIGILVFAVGCGSSSATSDAPRDTIQSPQVVHPERMATKYLPNAVRVHPKVISGGMPAGEPAFSELQSLGVKTIISVDGAKPDVERARKFGLRYVHLPHGYDGISGTRARELAKAVREMDGPIYIHCHHGKHRSPAAASVACVSAGLVPSQQAVAILKIAGTSESYRGLYASVEQASPIAESVLAALEVEYAEIAVLPPLAEAMVEIGHAHDRVQLVAASGWRIPREHPDLAPAHEVLLLREHYTELLRTEHVRSSPATFQQLLQNDEATLVRLEAELQAWLATDRQGAHTQLDQSFGQVSAGCKTCHQQYRDVPQAVSRSKSQ